MQPVALSRDGRLGQAEIVAIRGVKDPFKAMAK